MIKKISGSIILFLCFLYSPAQTIDLHFPHYAGKEYAFSLFQGTKKDTVQTGIIDYNGEVKLIMPEKYKNYNGTGIWNIEKFGIISFLVNGEDFKVSCIESYPSDENIVYSGSPENEFRKEKYAYEQELLNKIRLVNYGLSLYSKEDEIYQGFENEIIQLKNEFESLQDEIAQNKFYAARFLKILDFTNGITDRLFQSPQENAGRDALIRTFSEKMNIEDVYTSGLWEDVFNFVMELYPDESSLASDIIKILRKTQSQNVFEALATDIIRLTEMYGYFEARAQIASFIKDSERMPNPEGIVANAIDSLTSGAGLKAPGIGTLDLTKKLIIFYDSQCGNCMEEVDNMVLFYPKLQEKGYDVISISADSNKGLFEFTSKNFPWKNKLCDFKSFDGEHFINYGIIGTPTIIQTDEKGIIKGTYAALLDTGLIDL